MGYFHGYIDGVDYVFVDNHVFHSWSGNIYGGSREVSLSLLMYVIETKDEMVFFSLLTLLLCVRRKF